MGFQANVKRHNLSKDEKKLAAAKRDFETLKSALARATKAREEKEAEIERLLVKVEEAKSRLEDLS